MIEMMNELVGVINTYLYSYILIFVLLGAGIYYSIKTGFIQFNFKNIFASFKDSLPATNTKKQISSFEAFAVTTASRVGTGNIAGVALAITTGGPGAVFWMWVTALLGGALAFAESTLAQLYKTRSTDNSVEHYIGGPSFYIEKGLNSKVLGIIFSLLLVFVFGFSFNAVQSNTISLALQNSFNIPTHFSAIFLSILTAFFVFRGLHKIAKASAFIVPIMAILYLVLCIIVVGSNISRLPEVFSMIFQSAFGFKEFGIGVTIGTITTGIKRGLFSNEAGMGSAPNGAASAHTSHPIKQGLVQACGVFFDTIIICSATAFLILFSGIDLNTKASGITLTQQALGNYFGSFGSLFLTVCIFLLAFSSVLGNYFYAQNSVSFLTDNKLYMFLFQLCVIFSVFIGSISELSLVWNIADLLMGVMALINIYAIVRLSSEVSRALKQYKAQVKENKDPIFTDTQYECWK